MTTIRALTKEIRETNERLGWLDNENTWGELLALFRTEISEMVGHYRIRRMASYTTSLGKPDDVGAELADATIRLLSMYDIRDIPIFDMDNELADVPPLDVALDDFEDTFGDWVDWLHRRAAELWENPTWEGPLMLRALVTFAERWGLDLTAEVERKMAYNATRERHHGGTISGPLASAPDEPSVADLERQIGGHLKSAELLMHQAIRLPEMKSWPAVKTVDWLVERGMTGRAAREAITSVIREGVARRIGL